MSAATMNEMDRLVRERDEARAEREALAAHVERYRAAITPTVIDLVRCGIGANYGGRYLDEALEKHRDPLLQVSEAAPTTSLARIKAEELMNGATPCPDGGKCHKSGLTCGDPICEEWGADLKAEWQAEALELAAERLTLAVEADTVRAHLRNQARKLRRQAEESTNGHH